MAGFSCHFSLNEWSDFYLQLLLNVISTLGYTDFPNWLLQVLLPYALPAE